MTKTDALRKGLLLNGWTLYTSNDCRSGRECYSKVVERDGTKHTFYRFIMAGGLRESHGKPNFTDSRRVGARLTDALEDSGRRGLSLAELKAAALKLQEAQAGLAALGAKP